MHSRLSHDTTDSGWQAQLTLGFAARADGSYLAERRHSGPLRVQKPLYPEGPRICHAIIVHPPGGIAGGDTLKLAIDVGAASHAVLATPGASKWYKANGRGARQEIVLRVHEHACLDWLPQDNILFDAAQVELDLTLEIAESASAIGWEAIQLGRHTDSATHTTGAAHGPTQEPQRWQSGWLRASTTLKRPDGTLLWSERVRLSADDALREAPQGLAGQCVFGTLWAIGPARDAAAAQQLHEQLSALCGWHPELRSGFTCLPGGVMLVRAVAQHMQALQALFARCWSLLRPHLHGVPAQPLRIWST
jgi:urease accessory protein